jgi:CubicO group peptidase (beta-lactamase class C family)
MAFAGARAVIQSGLASRAYPAAVVDVGSRGGVAWREPFGALTYDRDAARCTGETIFDLASLTKVIATAPIAMRAIASGALTLDTRVADRLGSWRGADRERVTVRHLLDHSSGLPAHARLWEHAAGRAAFEAAIAATPLERTPGTRAVYSDLGFMLLGFLLEDAAGQTLDAQFDALARELGVATGYRPAADPADRIAPTEDDPWRGRVLRGEVHDENAAALGGVAAHAGLFGTAEAVGIYAPAIPETFSRETTIGSPALMRRFATASGVPDSSRALAWDTMRPTTSCGRLLSSSAIGHTGFTGTSLWIDPDRDLYVVFLTNRVHPTRENNQMPSIRPALHDAIVTDHEEQEETRGRTKDSI